MHMTSSGKLKNSRSSKATSLFKKKAKTPIKSHKKIQIKNNFPIVGIGSSAGGLEAICEFLSNLKPDSDMAFVVIQHLIPYHESKLSHILSTKTTMPVTEITKDSPIKANHVFVLPPNHTVKISHGILKLLPRIKTKNLYLPINDFFISLALDQKSNSIGILFSGTSSDGVQGLRKIKEQHGLTIVQDPSSAKFVGMPNSAIDAGVAKHILSPKEIGEQLSDIVSHHSVKKPLQNLRTTKLPSKEIIVPSDFDKILKLVKKTCQVDFSHYKYNTLKRRIAHQMIIKRQKDLGQYLEYLENNPPEITNLFNDLLIKVTKFFRDPVSFEKLKRNILPRLKKNKATSTPLRIWVVGCSTGEEVYSVAMVLIEFLGKAFSPDMIKIIATDISEPALAKASTGHYPESISRYISKERLHKFFVKTLTGYKIKNFLREICLFSRHDISNDPPFSKMDLICCRNLLIYMDKHLQGKVLSFLHYALNPQGVLWISPKENISKQASSLFNCLDKVNRFYLRNNIKSSNKFYFQLRNFRPTKLENFPQEKEYKNKSSEIDLGIQREVDHIASFVYSPPGVVVNTAMNIILIRGDITPYLHSTHGIEGHNLFNFIRAELAFDLRKIFNAAKKENKPIRKTGLTQSSKTGVKNFSIYVIPFLATNETTLKERYFLISFESEDSALSVRRTTAPKYIEPKPEKEEKEILNFKVEEKPLIQEFEIIQEELTAANEELQSSNEEMQNMNQELESSQEELQSTNVELVTVNNELQSRNKDLNEINDDLINILESVDMPIVIVGKDKRIRRFTYRAAKVFGLKPNDEGRLLSNIKLNFNLNMESMVSEVIEMRAMRKMSIQDKSGSWFRLQIRPYRTMENKIDGVVIALVDINMLKRHLIQSKLALNYATSVSNTIHLPLVVLDEHLHIISSNNAFYKEFQIKKPGNPKIQLVSLIAKTKALKAKLKKVLTGVFSSNAELKDFEVRSEIGKVENVLLLNGRRIRWVDKERPIALLLCIQDITERFQLEHLSQALHQHEKTSKYMDEFLATLSHELRTPLTSIVIWAQLLLDKGKDFPKLMQGLSSIKQNASVQQQMIDDLLNISRLQAGKVVLETSVLDPSEIVQSVIESVRPLAESKSLAIKFDNKSIKGKVKADPARLQQVISNIMTNAIKFSYTGKNIEVLINSYKIDKQKYLAIHVIDYGEGIDPELLPHLFERFTQADRHSTRQHGGLGLGLAIACDLTKLMQGKILAKSDGRGKGATFTILLPLISNKTKKLKGSSKSKSIPKQKMQIEGNLKQLKIMVVEDVLSSREAIAELLRSEGANIIAVSSVDEALAAFKNDKPDILVSDIAMPGKDGIDLIKSIRSLSIKKGGQTAALALTAYAALKDRKRALQAGFNAFLTKPFDSKELIDTLVRLAGRKKS